MNIQVERKKDTLARVEVRMTVEELTAVKSKVLKKMSHQVKLDGFRDGKAPLPMVEKALNQQSLQAEFIDEAVNVAYVQVLREERLRPIAQPKLEVTKFVPFTVLDFILELPVVGVIKLPNYKKLTAKREKAVITKKDIDKVIENLQLRLAEKKEVDRPAKKDDEAWIDFTGVDSDKKAIDGASGTDYPLVLGSGTFIPGFEDNLIGKKSGEETTFSVTFPKDYGVKKLQQAKVTFTVKLKKVTEVVKPTVNDEFAKKIGPFTTVEQLKNDIEKQLLAEKKQQIERDYETAIVEEISQKAKMSVPEELINEQIESLIQEVRQNALYRGMTWEQYLASLDMTEDEYRQKDLKTESERRVKAGLLLSEIADLEGIDVTPEELEVRLQQLKGQYKDDAMQSELDKPENRREIAGRLRTEKVLEFLKTQ